MVLLEEYIGNLNMKKILVSVLLVLSVACSQKQPIIVKVPVPTPTKVVVPMSVYIICETGKLQKAVPDAMNNGEIVYRCPEVPKN